MESFQPSTEVSFPVPDKKGGENPCNHVYHTKCIEKWLTKHSDCPICRNTFLGSKESQLFILIEREQGLLIRENSTLTRFLITHFLNDNSNTTETSLTEMSPTEM